MEAISSGASYWRNRKRRSVTNDRSKTQCDPSGILAYGDLLLPRLQAVAGANQSDDRYPERRRIPTRYCRSIRVRQDFGGHSIERLSADKPRGNRQLRPEYRDRRYRGRE